MPSFDIVSEVDSHELTNAVDQANREVATRYDFKGADAKFEIQEDKIVMHAEQDFQLQQMIEILRTKFAKRGIDQQCIETKDPEIQLKTAKQDVVIKQGISTEIGKKINKLIKDSKIKVTSQIQGDQVRVTGKKRDDLQEAMALIREANLGIPLQFNNFRD